MDELHDRWYEWLYQFKEMQELAESDVKSHTRIMRSIRGASGLIEERTGERHFYPVIATKKFDYQSGYELDLDEDLISITSVINGDGSTMDHTALKLYPIETPWHRRIHVNPTSSELFNYDDEPHQAIQIEGVWGYWDQYEDSEDTIQDAEGITDVATTITVTEARNFDVGQMLKIDDEAMFVKDRDTANETITVKRAKLGTTAATHDNGAAISIYRAPTDIELATSIITARIFRRWESVWADVIGAGPSRRIYSKGLPSEVLDLIGPYVWWAI